MQNLCITLHIDTPIIMGKYPLNLDGLLYWSAYEGHQENESLALEVLSKALDSQEGVFKSSDLIFLQTNEYSITQKEAVFTTNFNWAEHSYPLKKKRIMEAGGPYRSRMTTYNAIGCLAVRFYARGHADLIRFLLETAGFVGRGNNQGYGEISQIVIDEIEEDLSWWRTNNEGQVELQRCLPSELVKNIKVLGEALDKESEGLIKAHPPYTKTKETLGFSTKFKRDILDLI